jgi:uncharacterized protein
MNTGAVRVVLDTNVIVSMIGRLSPNRWIFDKILAGDFILCISNEILFEYEEILTRRITPEIATSFTDFLTSFPSVEQIKIYYNWNLIQKDPDDNKFIDCAVAAKAFCIVSEDKHFRPFKNNDHPPLRVFSVKEFKKIFG